MVGSLRWFVAELVAVVGDNRRWMAWNMLLAAVPAVLAVVLFRVRARRSPLWWCGVVAFVLFLPNAPYVITDLIHLRGDVAATRSNTVVAAGILPVYAAFVAAGLAAYAFALDRFVPYVSRAYPAVPASVVAPAAHLLCAAGIVLGRVARLNSWDTVTAPVGTLERVAATLSWRWAPVALLVMFAAVWAGHAVTCVLARPVLGWGRRLVAGA